jgi:hypothetical protein
MDDNGFALWFLYVRTKRIDGLHELLKKIILEWWISNT